MIRTYQDQQQLTRMPASTASMATVTGVYADGLTIRLDGEPVGSPKRCKCAPGTYASGDRVYVVKIYGKYLVVCKVGTPTI